MRGNTSLLEEYTLKLLTFLLQPRKGLGDYSRRQIEQLDYSSAVLRSKQARNTILYKPMPLGLGRMDVVHQMDFLAIQEATGAVPKWRWCPDLLHCARVTVAVLTPKKEVNGIKTFCITFKGATKIIITYQHLENLLVKHWQ